MKFLFTSVPLEEIINVTLDKIYHLKEINTSINKNSRCNLLLYTTYQQNDGEAMVCP